MVKTPTCHSEVEQSRQLLGDESNGVLNRKGSGADPSLSAEQFPAVYAIFLASVRDGTSWLRHIRWTGMRGI
jgi:hypothetical protein